MSDIERQRFERDRLENRIVLFWIHGVATGLDPTTTPEKVVQQCAMLACQGLTSATRRLLLQTAPVWVRGYYPDYYPEVNGDGT